MLGLLWWNGQIRGVSRPERATVAALPVVRVQLAPGGRWEKRRMERAARLLVRQGVRRVLPLRGFAWEETLRAQGLAAVDPAPLYRAMAARLTLSLLARRKLQPRCACVALRGEYAGGDLARAALELCGQVRCLRIDAAASAALERELYLRFGAACCPGRGAPPDVRVRFDGPPMGEELRLAADCPDLSGLRLAADLPDVPEELEPDGVLAALWQAGLLGKEEIRVVSAVKTA